MKALGKASVHTALMQRTVCAHCQHLHRRILLGKCDCCTNDIKREGTA